MPSMRSIALIMVTCVFLTALLAGCTNQPVSQPVTTPPPGTTLPVVSPPVTAAPLEDPALLGVWYLKAMTGPGGSTPVETMNVQINIIIHYQDLSGFGGCNDYSAPYTLTGQVLPDGNGITVGPITTTLKYCTDISATEATYLQTLQDATSYTINVNQQLSITDNAGSVLVYEKIPYGPLSVPPGA
jgi:heat shock protein HslJ